MQTDKQTFYGNLIKEVAHLEPQRRKEGKYSSIKIVIFLLLLTGGGISFLIEDFPLFISLFLVMSAFIAFGIITAMEPAQDFIHQAITRFYRALVSQTLENGIFTFYGKIPFEVFRNSNLFGDYRDSFEGYHISGEVNGQTIRIGRLQPRTEEAHGYYEGVLLTGTFVNPFPADLYFYHIPPDSDQKEERMEESYFGYHNRAGKRAAGMNLKAHILGYGLGQLWGTEIIIPEMNKIHTFTPQPQIIKKRLTKEYQDKLKSLISLFPDCDIYLSLRGNTFYMIINYFTLLKAPSDLTKTETAEYMSEDYLKVLSAAELLTQFNIVGD